jgi:hypothetical protein
LPRIPMRFDPDFDDERIRTGLEALHISLA